MAKKDVEKALETLRREGYRVSHPPEELVVKTFKIPRATSEAFYKKIRDNDLKVQDAIEEALKDWVKK